MLSTLKKVLEEEGKMCLTTNTVDEQTFFAENSRHMWNSAN